MSSKSGDETCAPLNKQHHDEYDGRSFPRMTRRTFEKKYGVNMQELAAQYYAHWWELTGRKSKYPRPDPAYTIPW